MQVAVNPIATTNTAVAVRDLPLAGAGFAIVPFHVVRDDLRHERLCRVCPSWYRRTLWLHALLPTRNSPRAYAPSYPRCSSKPGRSGSR